MLETIILGMGGSVFSLYMSRLGCKRNSRFVEYFYLATSAIMLGLIVVLLISPMGLAWSIPEAKVIEMRGYEIILDDIELFWGNLQNLLRHLA